MTAEYLIGTCRQTSHRIARRALVSQTSRSAPLPDDASHRRESAALRPGHESEVGCTLSPRHCNDGVRRGSSLLQPDCHSPRRRGIQYAAASRLYHCRLWNTGSSAFAGDDTLCMAADMPCRSRGLFARALLDHSTPSNPRGHREGRVPTGTRGPLREMHTQEEPHSSIQVTPITRPSLRDGRTAYAVLSREPNFPLASLAVRIG